MVKREISKYILSLKGKYPVLTITGPRQSGKTTLARETFPKMEYVNLEDLEEREFALNDPKGFLARFPKGAIVDEIQRAANLCSYIQVIVDKPGFKGLFVLTGSQNFAVRNTLNQSLAGRTAVLTLLPFSLKETVSFRKNPSRDEILFYGFYPPLYDRGISPTRFYHDYVQTYIERDLRQISLIHNLSLFQKFMGLCAGRTGQLLNYESLGNDTGISQTTVMEWISILEASYIVFRLAPFYKNIGKRLVKTPKLYFYDTGLASFLMGIDDIRQIEKHPLVGNLFENLIISETLKFRMNRGMPSNICFFRDSNGNEVDLIIPSGQSYFTVEIKAGTTINQDFFKGFSRFDDATGLSSKKILVYSGEQCYLRSGANVSSFKKYAEILGKLEKQ